MIDVKIEDVLGGRYWEPGYEDDNDYPYPAFPVDYDPEEDELPFENDYPGYEDELESIKITEGRDVNSVDNIRTLLSDMWPSDRAYVKNSQTGEYHEIDDIEVDEKNGYVYFII